MKKHVQNDKNSDKTVSCVPHCTSCGGLLSYTPGEKKVACAQCKNEYDVIRDIAEIKLVNIREDDRKRFLKNHDLEFHFSDYLFPDYRSECPSCGYELNNRVFVSGTCPACSSPYHVPFSKVESGTEPVAVFPFETSRQQAQKKFRWWYHFSIHRIFFFMRLKFDHAEKIVPCYYPVWVFDATVHAEFTGTVTPTPFSDPQEAEGETEISIQKAPVHALLPGNHKVATYCTRHLEWDLSRPKAFDPAVVAGIRTKPFLIGEQKIHHNASEELDIMIKQKMKEEMGGAHQEIHSLKTRIDRISFFPALIPLWMALATSNGKPVWFCMNGMNGKFIARSPSPPKKRVWFFGILFSLAFTVLAWYVYQSQQSMNAGAMIFAGIFSIFTVSALLAGLQKVFSMKLALWLAFGSDLFYMLISYQHIGVMWRYHVAVLAFILIFLALWKLSSSLGVDESEFDPDAVEKLES